MKNAKEFVFMLISLSIFIVTGFTLTTLSPTPQQTYIKLSQKEASVLGKHSSQIPTLQQVGGTHSIIKDEHLTQISPTRYHYQSVIFAHNAQRYSKPIIIIKKSSGKNIINLTLTNTTSDNNISEILLEIDNNQISFNQSPTQNISIDLNTDKQILLIVHDYNNVLFNENIEFDILITNQK